jgi:hypothetical protein
VPKHKVEVSISGDVFTAFCELEGNEVDLVGSQTGFGRTFSDFDINGDLNVFVHCKGLSGTDVAITVKVDSKEVLKRDGAIAKGFFRVDEAVSLA